MLGPRSLDKAKEALLYRWLMLNRDSGTWLNYRKCHARQRKVTDVLVGS